MLTAVLILAGIVLLAIGVVTGSTVLTAVALGLGVVAVVVLLLPLGPRTRGEPAQPVAAKPDEAAKRERAAKPGKGAAKPKAAKPVAEKRERAAKPGKAAAKPVAAKPPAAKPDEAVPEATVVLVVAGRHRFHRPGCELVEGKATEQLSPEEAQEEGFTACSRCVETRASI